MALFLIMFFVVFQLAGSDQWVEEFFLSVVAFRRGIFRSGTLPPAGAGLHFFWVAKKNEAKKSHCRCHGGDPHMPVLPKNNKGRFARVVFLTAGPVSGAP